MRILPVSDFRDSRTEHVGTLVAGAGERMPGAHGDGRDGS